MRIIDRYVLWSFVKNYLISFMVLVGMYIMLDMVFNFDELVDVKGNTDFNTISSVFGAIRDIGDYYFYQGFLFFVHLSGIIPVVAAAFTLMRLSRFNELTALLAAGVPLLRVSMPIILGGVVLNALMIADQELIIPQMLPQLSRSHDELHRKDVKTFPIEAMQDDKRGLLYAARYTPPGPDRPAIMDYIDVIEREQATVPSSDAPLSGTQAGLAHVSSALPHPTSPAFPELTPRKVTRASAHILADRAVWNSATRRWDLETWDEAHQRFLPYGERVTGLAPDASPSTTEPISSYQSNITPEEIALHRSGSWVDLLSTSRIDQLIARPGSYGQANLLSVKHWRFVQPIMNVVMLLLAIPCVLTREPGRLKSAATWCLILTGLAMGTVFICRQLAGHPPSAEWAQTWPALIAWVPIFIFGPLAVFLLERVKS